MRESVLVIEPGVLVERTILIGHACLDPGDHGEYTRAASSMRLRRFARRERCGNGSVIVIARTALDDLRRREAGLRGLAPDAADP